MAARCCTVSCSSVLVVAVELVPVIGPGCWAAAIPVPAHNASAAIAIRRVPIASSFKRDSTDKRMSPEMVSPPQSFAPIRDFSAIAANGPQYLRAKVAPAPRSSPPIHADPVLAPPPARFGAAGAGRRSGSRRRAGGKLQPRDRKLGSGAAREFCAVRSGAIADGREDV